MKLLMYCNFRERSTELDYVVVKSHDFIDDPVSLGGCYSSGKGRRGGKQYLNFERAGQGSMGCMYPGIIVHEFIHAWGFWHEHARPDRG